MQLFNRSIFLLLFILSIPFAQAAKKAPVAKTSAVRRPVSEYELIFDKREQRIVAAIDDVEGTGSIAVETPFLSSKKVQDALKNAKKRGASVNIHTTGRANADTEELKKKGCSVKQVQGLHAKRVITKKNNQKNANTTVFIGSDNLSSISWGHKECMAEVFNDENFYKENMATFDENDTGYDSPTPTGAILKVTPTKPTLTGSHDYDQNESKAGRVSTLGQPKNRSKKNKIDILSMTFDSQEIVDALQEVFETTDPEDYPTVRLILDRTALNHKDLLDSILKTSSDHVKIYIYNEDKEDLICDKFPAIMHRKAIVRKCMKKGVADYLTIISTGNLTEKSNKEINYDTYLPGDKDLVEKFFAENDKLIKIAKRYKGS